MSGSASDLPIKIGVEGLPQLESAFDKVEARLNTTAGAQRQYEQSTLLVQRAQESGAISSERAAQAMAALQNRFETQTREVNQASAAFSGFNSSLTSAAGRLGAVGSALAAMGPAGLAGAAAIGGLSLGMSRVAAAGDEMSASIGRVRAAAGSLEAAEAVYGRLYQISLQTGQSVSESAGQFSRFAIAAREIGATNSQALQLVDTLQKAAIVGGASMQEAASAATQLAQALASGRLNGDELGSLLENMPNLAVALARELGTSVGQLRKLGEAGELTAERVFPALLRAGADLNAEYEKMPATMSRAFDQLQVASGNFLGRLDQALGLSQSLARSLSNAATAMDAFSARATPTAEAIAGRNSSARGETVRQLRSQIGEYDQRIAATAAEVGANAGRDPVLAQLRAEREQVAALLEDETQLYRQAETERLAIGRDAREMERAEREDAAAKITANRRTQDQAAAADLRKALDKDLVARQEWQKRREGIERLVAAGTLSAADGDRLAALALKERDDAIESLTKKTRGLTDTQREARNEAQALARVWDTLRRDGQSGLLVGSENDLTALRAIRGAMRGTDLDPAEVEKRQREADAALKHQETEIKRTTDDVVRYGSELFADMFATTEGGWNRTWENMGRTARGLLARIAAEAVIRPVVTPIVGGLLGTTALSGTANAATGSAGSTGSIWSALSGGSISTGVDAWGARNLGFLGFSADASSMGLLRGGSAFGGFSSFSNVLGIAGSALPGLMSGNYKQAGLGAGGAAVGTMLGGPLGTVAGGLAGNLLGGLFGNDPARPASSVQIGIGPDGQLTIMGDRSKGMSSAEGIAAAQQTIAGLNQRVAASGLSLRQSNGAVAQTHQGSDARPGADAEEMTRVVLGSLQGGSAAVMNIIARELAKGAAASIDKAFSDIDWVKSTYEPLSRTTPAISEFEAAIDALNVTYGNAIQKASELGLATTDLAANMSKAIAEATAARDAQYRQTSDTLIARAMRGRGDDMGADLLIFDVGAGQERSALEAQLRAQGATGQAYADQMARLEEALWLERRQIAERGADALVQASEQAQRSATQSALGVITSLADYSRSLTVGSDSPLSAQEQFGIAERQFNAVSGGAIAGDARSLAGLQDYAQTYLQASRSLYGSTSGYAQAYNRVQDTLGQVGGLSADTLTASFYATQVETQTATLVQELQALRAAVNEQRREFQQLSAMQRLRA